MWGKKEMPITNKVMLITYPDSLGKNIEELRDVLNNDLNGAVGGIHLLPFFKVVGNYVHHFVIGNHLSFISIDLKLIC